MSVSDNVLSIRPAVAAGRFYPAEPQRLKSDISAMLTKAPAAPANPPKALIAPHAGYAYSGEVAARAFAMIPGVLTNRVILIGPAHYVAFRGIAVPRVDAFATPLGSVPVDRQGLAAFSDLPFVVENDAAHAPEHALEVELPFLQTVLGPFTLVPLLVGDASPREVATVLGRLWGGPETLIVVSSDLSHFHDYDSAQRLDAAAAALIESGAWTELGPNHACGASAIAGLLIEAERHGLRARGLALCNSGDSSGDRDRVVGYGSWCFAEASGAARWTGSSTSSWPRRASTSPLSR
jgi:AmmeMemoRadiSam system protein B